MVFRILGLTIGLGFFWAFFGGVSTTSSLKELIGLPHCALIFITYG